MTTITRYHGRTSIAISLIAALMLALPVQRMQAAGNPNPRIIPIGATPLGKTYGEWGAAWWQYVYSIPVHNPTNPSQFLNPLLDTTGADCAVGQANNPVFFLVGVIGINGSQPIANATRSCTVPAGKMIFFPILNVEADNIGVSPPQTVAQLQATAKAAEDAVTALGADIDGVQVANPFSYRAASPGAFSITFPADNIADFFGVPLAPGTYYPFVSDGYWLMLAPLPAGQHTVHFSGSAPGFGLDVTYHLTVASR